MDSTFYHYILMSEQAVVNKATAIDDLIRLAEDALKDVREMKKMLGISKEERKK
jgi:hypothetical protein